MPRFAPNPVLVLGVHNTFLVFTLYFILLLCILLPVATVASYCRTGVPVCTVVDREYDIYIYCMFSEYSTGSSYYKYGTTHHVTHYPPFTAVQSYASSGTIGTAVQYSTLSVVLKVQSTRRSTPVKNIT